jgi:cell wall-associated NlpC family hydrolase
MPTMRTSARAHTYCCRFAVDVGVGQGVGQRQPVGHGRSHSGLRGRGQGGRGRSTPPFSNPPAALRCGEPAPQYPAAGAPQIAVAAAGANADGARRRAAVVAEAISWLGTPFHHEARVKGAGVDCAMLLCEVYARAGLVGRIDVPHYPPDWHLHRDVERFLALLAAHAREIAGPPEPGDVALFRFGRCFSHGAIVTAWPRLIHANFAARAVTWGAATLAPLAGREARFFTVF